MGEGGSFEDIDSFDDTQNAQPNDGEDVQMSGGSGQNLEPQQPTAPQTTSSNKNQSSDQSMPKTTQAAHKNESAGDDDQALNLNLDLEEFIPDGKDVDFDQYAEQIKETAQKGVKQNLKQQVENASQPSEIDLEGLKQDLTDELKETAGDIQPPESKGIGQDRDQEKDVEADSEDVKKSLDGEETEKDQEDITEEVAKPDEDEESETDLEEEEISDSAVTRPSPPSSVESARRYDEATDSLYVRKNACMRVVMDVKEVESTLDLLRERLNKIDTEKHPAEEGKNLMSEVQRKLLDLENELFEEDTL